MISWKDPLSEEVKDIQKRIERLEYATSIDIDTDEKEFHEFGYTVRTVRVPIKDIVEAIMNKLDIVPFKIMPKTTPCKLELREREEK